MIQAPISVNKIKWTDCVSLQVDDAISEIAPINIKANPIINLIHDIENNVS